MTTRQRQVNSCVTVVEGEQWGDEGKGKISHEIAEDAGAGVVLMGRPNGGPQAGHTVYHGDKKIVLHLIPSGIFSPHITCFIGAGTVIDGVRLIEEMKALQVLGVECNNLVISPRAHLIMPWHKETDRLREEARGAGKIGTTQRGVGPCYADKANRVGVRAEELGSPGSFSQRVIADLMAKRVELAAMFSGVVANLPSVRDAEEEALRVATWLWPLVQDVEGMVSTAVRRGHHVLVEAAQAALLDVNHGTYPFVTSSGCTVSGVLDGAGIPPLAVKCVIGVAKAYVTRVGGGPMPTEDKGEVGEYLCERGKEFGSTTGRQRRCGWLDLPALRRATTMNGTTELALTKLDVLTGLPEVKVCVGYRGWDGEDDADVFWKKGMRFSDAEPLYATFPGWSDDIAGVRQWSRLCAPARRLVEFIDSEAGVPVTRVSTGPGKDDVIRRE